MLKIENKCVKMYRNTFRGTGKDTNKKGRFRMEWKIVTIPGDGIGPEIVREACKVLDQAGRVYGQIGRAHV